MSLYAVGDFHLSFQVNKPMDSFGGVWKRHEEKIQKNCNKLVHPEDTIVITGDHSWGRNLEECSGVSEIYPVSALSTDQHY